MAECPRCRRPVAVARPRCLYCGVPLASDLVAAAQASAQATLAAAAAPGLAPERTLLILDLAAADPRAVAAGLGLSAFEAEQRVRRGGVQLHRIAEAEAARAEAERLAAHGLSLVAIPEAEVHAPSRPLAIRGGRRLEGALALRSAEGELRLGPTELLLVVRGPITREYQTPPPERRFRSATLDPGYRFQLHRVADPRPLELDPAAFDFGATGTSSGSSLLELSSWLEPVTAGVPVDDGFRRLPPALAPASEGRFLMETAGALAGPAGGGARKGEAPVILDNLAQFRFHSAWRGALERRRRGLAG